MVIKVYDILGNQIAVLVNGEKEMGLNTVIFDAQNLSSGIYFYNLITGGINLTKKMIVLK